MENTENLDLEDIEARLYSQVFHSSTNYIEEIATVDDPALNNYTKKYRYFQETLDKPINLTYIPISQNELENNNFYNSYKQTNSLSSTSLPSVQNIFTFPTTIISTSNNPDTFQNNITINQCSHPLTIDSNRDQFVPIYTEKDLKNKKEGNKTRDFLNKYKRHIKRVNRKQRKQQNTVIVYISDSDTDECVDVPNNMRTQNEISTKFFNKSSEVDGGNLLEEDDDIIFIPPPPVEVINVDIDESLKSPTRAVLPEENKSPENSPTDHLLPEERDEQNTEISESNLSNDFLDNSNIESNNFNFSLHGTDFNSGQTEIVQHQKPNEYCETESSCSTNEQQREFSNTVKTIVFDEVEFPREDIFSEKNLDSFSSFITPKRNCSNKQKDHETKSTPSKLPENLIDICSDTSSSESDYDNVKNNRKIENLPNLSPMVPCDSSTKKTKKTAVDFFKSTNKMYVENNNDTYSKKKKSNSGNENLEISSDDVYKTPITSKTKKKRKKSCNKQQINNVDETVSNEENVNDSNNSTNQNEHINEEKAKKRKKKDNGSDLANVPEQLDNRDDNEMLDTFDKSKKKKKKRGNSSSEKSVENEGEISNKSTQNEDKLNDSIQDLIKGIEITTELANNMSKKKKKKKKHEKKIDTNSEDETLAFSSVLKEPDNPELSDNPQREDTSFSGKGKKNKRKRELLLHDNTEIEESVEQNSRDQCDITNEVPSVNSLDHSLIIIDECENTSPEPILLDSDSSNESKIILDDSDGELDFERLDDIGHDLSLNCSSTSTHVKTGNVTEQDVERIMNTSKQPLDNYEQFDVQEIWKKQSAEPSKWRISYLDGPLFYNPHQNKGPRCNRCRQLGHIGIKCPDKPHPPSCTLCGSPRHQEPRCPNKRCTQCGNRGDYSTTYCWQCFKFRNSICHLCKMPGHIHTACPDLWRRYHLTVDGPMIESKSDPKPRSEQWCSGCAKRGHLEHECNYTNRIYPSMTPFIISYLDVLANKIAEPERVYNRAPNLEFNNGLKNTNPTNIHSSTDVPQTTSTDRLIIPSSSIDKSVTIHVVNNPPPNDTLLQMTLNVLNQLSNQQSNQFQPTAGPSKNTDDFQSPVERNMDPNNIDINDTNKIKHMFMSAPNHVLTTFIENQLELMKKSNIDPRVLKRKLFKYDRILGNNKSILPDNVIVESNFWYRNVNMFVFGINEYGYGKSHVKCLKLYLSQVKNYKLDVYKRHDLYNAYSYIFGVKKHKINYYKVIRQLIRKYYSKV